MKKTEIKVLRYDVTDKFYVEVMQGQETIEFWLCHRDYGVKDFMFGLIDVEESEYEDFIERNIYGYMHAYIEDRRKEDEI